MSSLKFTEEVKNCVAEVKTRKTETKICTTEAKVNRIKTKMSQKHQKGRTDAKMRIAQTKISRTNFQNEPNTD